MAKRRSRFVAPKGAMTVKEAAESTGYSVARISKLLGENRIVGTFKRKGRRLIPTPIKFLTTKGEEKLLDKAQRGKSDSVVDPNEVCVTGENSFIRLAPSEGADFTTVISHWRVLFSPAGPGHALFMRSDLTDDKVVAYSDNVALARWLQEEIESMINPPFSDTSVRIIEAEFEREGDVRSYSTERIESRDEDIALTWYDTMTPFAIHAPPGTGGRSHGVYSIMTPARRAQVVINGEYASGNAQPAQRDGTPSTTACLAWSESWVRPRA